MTIELSDREAEHLRKLLGTASRKAKKSEWWLLLMAPLNGLMATLGVK